VFSGGTVGALQSWSSTVPLTLDTLNGNITFQCADEWTTPYNITLSGALTGPGGLYKTGGGTLTLSGANDYAGSTVVSNGILKIVPTLAPTNGR
jgi:autotransporter-associated beta strand protein